MTNGAASTPLPIHAAMGVLFVGLPQLTLLMTGAWVPAMGVLAPICYLGGFSFGRSIR